MTISNQIIEVLDVLCDKLGVAVDWTSENIVPYIETLIRKFITFEIATSIMYIVLFIALFTISYPITKKWCKKASSDKVQWCDCLETWVAICGIVLTVAFGIVCLIGIPVQIHDIIEAITFPEKTITEYISNLLRNQ